MADNYYLPLIRNLILDPARADFALELTEKSAKYISMRALKQDSSLAKADLEQKLDSIGISPADSDKFAETLVKYVFENRRK